MSLIIPRSTLVERRLQIAEARRGDAMKLIMQHDIRQKFALIEASAAPMDHENIGSDTMLRVLNVAVRRGNDCALPSEAFAGGTHARAILYEHSRCSRCGKERQQWYAFIFHDGSPFLLWKRLSIPIKIFSMEQVSLPV
jgi:hypothetical protein